MSARPSFASTLPWLVVGGLSWVGYLLVRQNGRIVLRLEALEAQTAQLAQGSAASAETPEPVLPIGRPAPPFTLASLDGTEQTLAQYAGRRLLLIFFSPQCSFCRQMAPALGELSAVEPLPIVLASGSADAVRALMAEHGVQVPVLLDAGGAIAQRYLATGTPMGYLVDRQGRIESPLLKGADALLAVAASEQVQSRLAATGAANGAAGATADGQKAALPGQRPLAESRILRTGLPVGAPAPDFSLPSLDDAPLGPQNFRNRPLLLVFSDPHCGPCQALASELEQVHRRAQASRRLHVLVVSRGEREANEAKRRATGATHPIVLQNQWEVSRLYGIFATPVAFLIDATGSIAAPVAQGPADILALAERALSAPPAAADSAAQIAAQEGGRHAHFV